MKTKKFFTTVRIKPTIFLSCILALCALAYYSLSVYEKRRTLEPEVYNLLNACPAVESYPDSDFIHLLDETVEEVFSDGRTKTTVHKVYKILSETGKIYASFGHGYYAERETLSFVYAKAITPEGKVIPLKHSVLKRDTTDDEYDFNRIAEIQMPEVSVGWVIDYKYVIETKQPEIEGEYENHYLIQGKDPVVLSRHKVTFPEHMELKYLVLNPLKDVTISPVIAHLGDKKTYLFEYKNIPPILEEKHRPRSGEIAFQVSLTTFDSWEDYSSWFGKMIEGKTEPDERIKEKVAELTRGLTNSMDRIEAIFDYVATEIKDSLGPRFYIPNHEPRHARSVYGSKEGNYSDKSTLLISMLKVAGIPAYYVLKPTNDRKTLIKNFPSDFQFGSRLIVAVECEEGYRFLYPSAYGKTYFKSLPPFFQGLDLLIFKDHETVFATTPLAEAKDNAYIRHQRIEIMPKGAIEAEVTTLRSGSIEAHARSAFHWSSPADIKESQIEYVAEVSPWAKLLEHSFTDPRNSKKDFIQRRKYCAPDYCKKAGDILVFRVPSIGKNCDGIDKEKRQYPISFWAKSYRKHEVEFNVPEGYEIYHLPEPVETENLYFEYRSDYHRDGDKVFYQAEFNREALDIPLANYDNYRECCQDVEKSCERYVLFREKK